MKKGSYDAYYDFFAYYFLNGRKCERT